MRWVADGEEFDSAQLGLLPPSAVGAIFEIRVSVERAGTRVIAIDDDPTGTQTVAGASLITSWEPTDVSWLLDQPEPIGFVLTNSRARTRQDAAAINRLVGQRIRSVAEAKDIPVEVVSRSDSTLRGHFPAEVTALAAGLGIEDAPTLIVPFFAEGGRITVNGIHYVRQDDRYVPVAGTPFAADRTFGYSSSYLPAWVEEKTGGHVLAETVTVIDIEAIRRGGVDAVAERLALVGDSRYCVVDAVEDADLHVLVAAIRRSERLGRRWMYRSAASLVPALVGIKPAAPVEPTMLSSIAGGLVVVGSHVPLSSRQLEHLLAQPWSVPIEADPRSLADPVSADAVVRQLVESADAAIDMGRTGVMFTSRELVTGADAASSLELSTRVADSLCKVVAGLRQPPAYLVAKGGITAHTIAVDGLGANRARVIGPIVSGVPMWEMDASTRFPGLPYVVFPGNVGTDGSLSEVVTRLEAARS